MSGMMGAVWGEIAMKRRARWREGERRDRSLLLVLIVALFVVLLMIRMLAFVAGHGGHHY